MRTFPAKRLLLFVLILISVQNFAGILFAQDNTEQKDPVELFNKGQDAHEKGEFAVALKYYEEALKLAPEFPEAEFQMGSALQSLGRDTDAEKAYRRTLELRENWGLPIAALGEILVNNGKFAEAENYLTKAITIDSGDQNALVSLAVLRLKTKAAPAVLQILFDKISSNPNPSASLWAARGALEKELGNLQLARQSLNRSIALEPNNSYALAEFTKIYLGEKNYPKALETANNLRRVYPNSTSAKLLLVRCLGESGDLAGATELLNSLDPQNSEVISIRNALIAGASKDVAALEVQLENDPQNGGLLGRLCLLTRTNSQKALEYCRRASEVEPKNITHAVGFGAALVQAKQFESAVALFRKLSSIEPDNLAIHANLATSLFELKRYAEAKIEYNWLIEHQKDLAIAYYFLAICYDNLAEYSDALKTYNKFLQIADPTKNQLEIDKVNLRLPILERQVKKGRKK